MTEKDIVLNAAEEHRYEDSGFPGAVKLCGKRSDRDRRNDAAWRR